MSADEKPFACNESGCGQRFTNEDHLAVHRKKHEMSLSLSVANTHKQSIAFIDQTPTPTRFIKNCEEVGLFQDLQNVNPFDEQFRRASTCPLSTLNVHQTTSLTVSTSDHETLNTPSVYPASLHHDDLTSVPTTTTPSIDDEDEDIGNGIKILTKENERVSKVISTSEPSSTTRDSDDEVVLIEPSSTNNSNNESIISSTSSLSKETKVISSAGFSTSNVHVAPPHIISLTEQGLASRVVSQPVLSIPQPVVSSAAPPIVINFSRTSNEIPNFNQVQAPSTVIKTVQLPITTILKQQQSASVDTNNICQTNNVQLMNRRNCDVISDSPAILPLRSDVNLQSSDGTKVQLLLKLPNGTSVPLQIPNLQIGQTTTNTTSVITSSQSNNQPLSDAKMRLKLALVQNQTPAKHIKSVTPVMNENAGADRCSTDSSGSAKPSSACAPIRKRRSDDDDDPDEKRMKFLERNRAAATRCRQRRKYWIDALETKAQELTVTNNHLQAEVTSLKNEVLHLKGMLLAHKDCPVTLQQIEEQNQVMPPSNVYTTDDHVQVESAQSVNNTMVVLPGVIQNNITNDDVHVIPFDSTLSDS